HLFFNGRAHRRISDVRIDFNQEISTNYHRFTLGVVDVIRDHCTAFGNFIPDELWRDLFRDISTEIFTRMLLPNGQSILDLLILTNSDKLHLWCYNAFSSIM